jgi:hypothetical protein
MKQSLDKGICERVAGRNVVKSAGFGTFTPEDVKNLTDDLHELAKAFGSQKWAYIADPTKMNPLFSKETSQAFMQLHVELEANGCVAIAFLDGNTAAMKLQSQKHQDKSESQNMVIGHFKTEQEALDWLTGLGI